MNIFRLQNNVPDGYVDKSRDFQVLCRLNDILINGIKFNIDSITKSLNSATCSNNLLSLLQTKLGFISNKTISDESLRYILMSFPYILKYKGSKQAIKETINLFIKLNDLNIDFDINYSNAHSAFSEVNKSISNWESTYSNYFYYDKNSASYKKFELLPPTWNIDKFNYALYNPTTNTFNELLGKPSNWLTNYFDYYYKDCEADNYSYVRLAGVIPTIPDEAIYEKVNKYEIEIIFYDAFIDNREILNEIFKYILPTGYIVKYKSATKASLDSEIMILQDNVKLEFASTNLNSAVAPVVTSGNINLSEQMTNLNATDMAVSIQGNYYVLIQEPADWSTNYTNYYTYNSSNETYLQITEYVEFTPNTYFSNDVNHAEYTQYT